MENLESEIFSLISHGGNAKALAYEALECAEKFELEKAKDLLLASDGEMNIAHNIQTRLIQEEINGKRIEKSLLLIHAQDHFMAALSEKTLIEHLIKLYGILNKR